MVVTSELVTGFPGFAWLGPIVGPVGTAGLVLAMVIFMLLERRDLRDRLIGLFGLGHLTVTTKAFDEAGMRVSRQLLMQSLVNLVYGIAAGIGLYVLKGRMLASEVVSLVQAQGVSVVCLADLPPSPPSKTRYLVKRLHAALPELRILVGRWSPRALADDSTQPLRDAGATLVVSTLTETRTYLSGLVEIPRISLPSGGVQVA